MQGVSYAENNSKRARREVKRPKIQLPSDFDSEAEFLADLRQKFYDDIQFDRLNRESALEDLKFVVGDQWDDIVRQRREAARKPTLTINRLPAFLAQVIGQRRQNETDIKIAPDNGGTVDEARVREDLVRNIQKQSRAGIAYDKAFEGELACGIGNFLIELEHESDEVWDQTIRIKSLNDHLSVVWDRSLTEPSGADAGHVNVCETMTKKSFYKKWPWATPADMVIDVTLRGDLRMNGWIAVDDVRVVTNYRMRSLKRMIALMTDGSTQDITDEDIEKVLPNIQQRQDGTPIMREIDRKFCEAYICSGLDILDGPFTFPISRVPVFRVPGWEISVGEWKHRWGLTRFLKDPQRLHNYWRSVIAEKIMQTPRAVWLAGAAAVAGRENVFRQSHLSDDPLLIWNDESGQKPERVPPATVEDSLLGQAELTTQDIKDVSNIHEANLGMPSNEVSGAAISARQRVSDTGTVLYHDNLNHAIEECGKVVNELIPYVYDAPRIIQVMGIDSKKYPVAINGFNQSAIDIGTGKYSVTITTGPSYETKRIESAENMMNLANAMPQTLAVSADLIVEAQDWPGADEIARRLRLMLPPGVLDPSQMDPQMQQRAASMQQQQQVQQTIQLHQAIAAYMQASSQAQLNSARAANFQADAASVAPKLQNESMTAASEAAARELSGNLDSIRAAHGG